MSYQSTFERPSHAVRIRSRVAATVCVGVSHVLVTLPAQYLIRILTAFRVGAAPASVAQASAARDAVVAASLRCANQDGCLLRSVSSVILCRLRGVWPTWCVGVHSQPPFSAHAWIEVDGALINEVLRPESLNRLVSIDPPRPGSSK
ncbi:lasso peptide biosynthesis B2 protein [Microbacterium sp. NPDC055910]|uniref:lasso peptide biosynthesis B2 protein n=1 Tax=Microbacterium sp. NPDC055910 TaxID=3345659 RepID=UPI0035E03E2A